MSFLETSSDENSVSINSCPAFPIFLHNSLSNKSMESFSMNSALLWHTGMISGRVSLPLLYYSKHMEHQETWLQVLSF